MHHEGHEGHEGGGSGGRARSESGELVFVYGTLRAGASNHWRMEGAEFQGKAVVRGRLYRVGWYPGLVLDPAGGEVAGEVYEVTPDHLARLDEFEGEEFRRREAEVMRLEPYFRQLVFLWESANPVDEVRRIGSGDWMEASRARVLPLFLWTAWSPVLLVIILGLLFMLLSDPAPSSALPSSGSSASIWKFFGTVGFSSVVMMVGGLLARRRGERPRAMATIIFLLGLAGIVVPLTLWLYLRLQSFG